MLFIDYLNDMVNIDEIQVNSEDINNKLKDSIDILNGNIDILNDDIDILNDNIDILNGNIDILTDTIKKSSIKNKTTTTQLNNESEHLKMFKDKCSILGLEYKESWGNGPKNKKQNKNSDDDVIIKDIDLLVTHFDPEVADKIKHKYRNGDIVTINRKTKNGVFCWFNGGCSMQSVLLKYLNLNYLQQKNITDCNNQVKKIRQNVGFNKKWNENYDNKSIIKKIYQDTFYDIFINHIKEIFDFYNKRLSDFNYFGDKLSLPIYEEYIDAIVEKYKDDSIKLGKFKIRFKAASSYVKTPWKMNCEYS